jgi:hypothetical protein
MQGLHIGLSIRASHPFQAKGGGERGKGQDRLGLARFGLPRDGDERMRATRPPPPPTFDSRTPRKTRSARPDTLVSTTTSKSPT